MRRAILPLATMGTLLVMASGTALAQVTVTLSPEDASDLPAYSEHTVTGPFVPMEIRYRAPR